MIYLLLALLIGLFLAAFFVSGEDILAPSVIACFMWIFSTTCAIYNIDNWGIQLHLNTIVAIFVGLCSFMLGDSLGKNVPTMSWGKSRNRMSLRHQTTVKVIPVSGFFFLLFLIVGIFTIFLQYRWVLSQVGGIGVWSDMMTAYRSGNSTYSLDAISKPSLLSNMEILLTVNAYVSAYIGINNIFAGGKISHQLKMFLPGLLFAVDKILNAGRGDILLFIGAIVLGVYICMQRKSNWKKKISWKYIKYMFFALIGVTAFFSISRSWVGRTNEEDMLEYITTYAGGSVQLFDMYMQDPEPTSTILGKRDVSYTP